jgi:hypothetical protein
MENQLHLLRREIQPARDHGAVLAHALDVARRHLVLVLGEDGEPLDRLELCLIRQALSFGDRLQRGAQACSTAFAHFLEMRVIAPELVLGDLQSQQRRRSNPQFGDVDRLGDEIVGTRLHRVQPMLPRFEARDHDDRHVAAGRILPDPTADIETVETGHDDVEEDEIDAELQLGKALESISRCFDIVPDFLDQHPRDLPDPVIVVNDEHALAADAVRRGRSDSRRQPHPGTRVPIRPSNERSTNALDVGFDLRDEGVQAFERIRARCLDELGTRARDRLGADDGDAPLKGMGSAIQGVAIAERGSPMNRLHLARALAHQRVDELRDQAARTARLEAAKMADHLARRIRCRIDVSHVLHSGAQDCHGRTRQAAPP